ncbi:uncharacterized protein LOC136023503 [Lathamus discolor]|uniref:uncharacterized protein LOC136023503 n=1 Tax=Lathamus discolor TaxID=678569 RepID=UPI0032B72248
MAPTNTIAAPKASVVVSNASVVPTRASVVPKTSVVPNSSVVPKALVAAANASVVPKASVAPSISVVPNASVTIPNALVATNASVNSTEAMKLQLTCQSFQCSGERCYQDGAHANETVTCHNETYCELYRFSSTNYTARCSSACGSRMCRTNSSVSTRECALDCCNSSLCLQLNASSYGDLPPATTPLMTTTSRAPPQNGKVCAAFSCHGDGCFRGKKAVARCSVGQDFCEMKKMGLNYMAGCSKACKAAKPVCAAGTKAACYQECCPATLRASCLRLDGKVHVSGAGRVTAAPLLMLMGCGVVLLLTSRGSASLWGCLLPTGQAQAPELGSVAALHRPRMLIPKSHLSSLSSTPNPAPSRDG